MLNKRKVLTALMILFSFISLTGKVNAEVKSSSSDFIYLSDIEYVKNKSFVGWKTITYDKTPDNTNLSVKVEGAPYTFDKGIFAHATSTVVYDLTNYSEYEYFTSYVGLNTTSTRGDGVTFDILTSVDGVTYESKLTDGPFDKVPGSDATFVKIDIRGAKYLKLVADDKASNASDHSVYVDAKLIKNGYTDSPSGIKTVAEYNELLKKYDGQDIKQNKEYELILLQRELVSRAGEYALKRFVTESEDNKATIDWLFSDVENIRYYILGGAPTGSYYNSLTQLTRLLKAYKSDFDITETSATGVVKGDLYKRMAVAISLTHSSRVGLWMQSNEYNESDAVTRYKLYKDLYNQGKFRKTDAVDYTPWFEQYNIEELRWVVGTLIDDESVIWLNEYVQSKIDAAPNRAGALVTPHSYIAYVWPNYSNDIYYAPENKEYFNELFSVNGKGLFEYIPYRDASQGKIYKLWMNFRNKFGTGCVCGGISKSGHCIRGVNGIASAVIGQPGHAALLYYTRNSEGKGYWGIDNDVSGWNYSEKGERILLGWGNDRTYVKGYNIPYIVLAQEALNDYENLEKAEEILYTASIYEGDNAKQEEIYRKALEVQSINLDAWAKLAKLYVADETKTEEQCYQLAKEMMEALKCFPFPMNNLSNYISQRFVSTEYKFKFALLQEKILIEAKNYPNENSQVLQPSLTRGFATHLLGQIDTTLATFSFDGDDAEKIVLSERFNASGIRWDYSLDGKKTWKEIAYTAEEEHKHKLTEEEIKSITSENDIYVHIVGANYDEENIFKIDIQESVGLPETLYANDLENKLIAAIPTIKWQMKGDSTWNFYKDKEPDLTGNKTIVLKAGARETFLESNTTTEYTFTEDVVREERKYIPISHLSIHAVSTEATAQGRQAVNAIDGNLNTNWHSAWNGSDTQKYIVIKLDEVKNLTALEYFPQGGGNGKILSAQVLVSLDGENWTEIVSGTEWRYQNANDVSMKNLEFDPVKAQYIKIVGKQTQNSFIAARMFNFYEDTTAKIAGTFSFDGINKNQIVIDDEFINKAWEYSIDGGTTWKAGRNKQYKLTQKEIEQINENDKIKLRFSGISKEYTINIKSQEAPTISAYLNDLENRLIGITNTDQFEWKIVNSNGKSTDWELYDEEEPIVKGDSTLQIRKRASGITKASEAVEFNFTADTDTDKQTYIPIKHLSIADKSTESSGELASYAIDGNNATMWHTNHSAGNGQDERFIVIKLDEPKYISKVQYVKKDQYKFGILKNGIISTSMDGNNFEDVVTVTDLYNPTTLKELLEMENVKDIPFEESKQAQYIKIKWTKSCDYTSLSTADFFATAAMINLFEDTTKVEKVEEPTADIEYSTKELTNQNVIATLVNESTDITVTNNGGNKTHTFEENGEFTFEFVDKKGTKGTATAKVDWIDKVAPTAKVTYSTKELTNEPVIATLTNRSEDITITNNDGSDTYTFNSNGEFTFNFVDEAGNTGSATAKVDWIMTSEQEYQKLKEEIIRTIEAYKSKVTEEEINNKLINKEEKKKIVDAYNKLQNDDKTEYKAFIDRILAGGKPIITLVQSSYTVKYGTEMNLYDFITIRDNEDGVIKPNEDNVKIKTQLDTKVPGTYLVEYEVTDSDKNVSKASIQVTVMELKIPTAEIKYSTKEQTSGDVEVELVNASAEITILNNNGSNKYTFTKNGEFTFKFVDEEGNEGQTTAKVTWIDKNIPTGIITYDIEDKTNKDVTATLTVVPGVKITNNNGSNVHVFTESGEFTFELESKTGVKGTVTAKVDWINKEKPVGKVTYNINTQTAEDVTATLEIPEGVRVTNNNGSNKYTFTKNEEFIFEFADEYGNTGTATAKVTWIDKSAPTAKVSYNIKDKTNKDVIATLTLPEGVKITNNGGKNTYTFTTNKEFVFELVSATGVKGTATAKVTWIDKEKPTAKIKYSTQEKTDKPVIATLVDASEKITITNNNGKDTYTFTKNGEFTFEFVDEVGNKGTAVAKVDWIQTVKFENGDINKDNKITMGDLLLLKKHMLSEENQEWKLSASALEIADMNGDSKITPTDILLLKRAVLSNIEKAKNKN